MSARPGGGGASSGAPNSIACIGGGPASLTVARDLAPLGYDITIYEADPKAGGFMRTQVPRFRLPESVIDEEVGYILRDNVQFVGGRTDRPVTGDRSEHPQSLKVKHLCRLVSR